MSRRRKPSRPADDTWRVDIICTGRDTHPPERLWALAWEPVTDDEDPDGDLRRAGITHSLGLAGGVRFKEGRMIGTSQNLGVIRHSAPGGGRSGYVLPSACPRCGRDMPLRWERASERVEAAARQRVPRIDLSLDG